MYNITYSSAISKLLEEQNKLLLSRVGINCMAKHSILSIQIISMSPLLWGWKALAICTLGLKLMNKLSQNLHFLCNWEQS